MKSGWSNITLVLLIIGGLNGGVTGFWGVDLVSLVFGELSLLTRTIYLVIAAAAIFKLARLLKRYCPRRSYNPIR